jgi:hypothetical protein
MILFSPSYSYTKVVTTLTLLSSYTIPGVIVVSSDPVLIILWAEIRTVTPTKHLNFQGLAGRRVRVSGRYG